MLWLTLNFSVLWYNNMLIMSMLIMITMMMIIEFFLVDNSNITFGTFTTHICIQWKTNYYKEFINLIFSLSLSLSYHHRHHQIFAKCNFLSLSLSRPDHFCLLCIEHFLISLNSIESNQIKKTTERSKRSKYRYVWSLSDTHTRKVIN